MSYPTYYSVRRGQTLELRRGGYGTVTDAVLGDMSVPIKPLKIRFRSLEPGFPVLGMPSRGGYAEGILTVEDAVRQIRKNATELGPAADPLPEDDDALADWIVQTLRKHSGKSSLFVEVANAEDIPEGSDLAEEFGAAGIEAEPVGVIVQREGSAYCRACDRSLDTRGLSGHRKSNKHKANLARLDSELRAAAGI